MLPSTTVQLTRITICRGEEETIVHQLSRQIREMILSGKLAIGTRIPSTRELGNELRVSRTTVRESYEQLVAESYLSSSVGKGTFVINHPVLRAPPREHSDIDLSNRPQSMSGKLSPKLSKRGKRYRDNPRYYTSSQSLPFNPALPDFSLFPYSKWTRILKKTLVNPQSTAMNYGDAAGYPPLKRAIAENI
jgi:GntR family transcriptional regulator/MocR family aminotransferase